MQECDFKSNLNDLTMFKTRAGPKSTRVFAKLRAIECLKANKFHDVERYIEYIKDLDAEQEVKNYAE